MCLHIFFFFPFYVFIHVLLFMAAVSARQPKDPGENEERSKVHLVPAFSGSQVIYMMTLKHPI